MILIPVSTRVILALVEHGTSNVYGSKQRCVPSSVCLDTSPSYRTPCSKRNDGRGCAHCESANRHIVGSLVSLARLLDVIRAAIRIRLKLFPVGVNRSGHNLDFGQHVLCLRRYGDRVPCHRPVLGVLNIWIAVICAGELRSPGLEVDQSRRSISLTGCRKEDQPPPQESSGTLACTTSKNEWFRLAFDTFEHLFLTGC